MKEVILRHDSSREFPTAEGCEIIEISNSDADTDLSIARARVRPRITTQRHRLDGAVERYLIVSGRGEVEVGELPPADVGPGDVVIIPDGVLQRVRNTGAEDLIFYCICTPRFESAMYIAMETD